MNKEELARLYYTEGKTLQEIGKIYDLSRERIRQIMESYNLPRDTKKGNILGLGGPKTKFDSLDDYFSHVKKGGKESRWTLLKFFRPLKKGCEDCGSTINLHIHHLVYPGTLSAHIQILCASCHHSKHRKGTDIERQLEICRKYVVGKTGLQLAKEYNLHKNRIYQILRKWNIKTRPAFGRNINQD